MKFRLKDSGGGKPIHIISLIFLMSFFCICASAYAQRLTMIRHQVSLKTVLTELEKQAGVFFLYDNNLVNRHPVISVSYENQSLDQIMKNLSSEFDFQYNQVDKTITLSPSSKVVAQETVRGIVHLLDAEGKQSKLAANATIQVKGSKVSTTTNEAGIFSIAAQAGQTLIISFIGYSSREIKIPNTMNARLEIELTENIETLKEVLIEGGYGIKESKENQVGSAYVVTAKDLERRPSQRVDRLLEGLVPGFEIASQDQTNSSVRPRYQSRIRGEASVSSITSNEPLWVIDGVKITTGGPTNLIPGLENSISPLSFLNPEDIESMTVLKDASATSIYGANGSNGVILITTKKGTGKSKINYSYKAGLNQITNNRFQVLSGDEYNSMLLEMGLGEHINNFQTDWYDLYYRNGLIQQHNLSFSGSEKNGLQHYVSAGIYNEKQTIIANSTQRFTLRTNLQKDFGERISFQLNTGGSYNLNALFNPTDEFYMRRPNINAYNPDGTYALRDDRGKRIFYSLAEAEQNDNNQRAFSILTNGGVTIKILKGLNFRSDNGLDFSSSNENEYRSMQNLSGESYQGYARKASSNVFTWNSANTLTYHNSFASHSINLLAGMEAKESIRRSTDASASNFANDYIREISYAPEIYRKGGGSGSENSSLSYFGRVAYEFDRRYNFTASTRIDGDSNFGTSVKYATFAAAAASWTVSNESFWNYEQEVINFLKFKASFGTNGNSRFSSNYSKGIYSFDSSNEYDGQAGAIMSRGANNLLKWETTYIFNTGIDARLFRFLNVALEYYQKKTVDLIDNAIVSSTSGQRRVYQNSGKIQNTGLELVLESTSVPLGPILWYSKIIASGNRNKVLELPEGQDRVSDYTIRREGYSSGSIYLVKWAGVDPRDGMPMWYDINGNITKTHDAANRIIIGDSAPDFSGSFLNNFTYKNFSLSVSLLFTKGGLSFSRLRRNSESDGLNLLEENQSKNQLDHWRAPGDLSLNPKLSAVSTRSSLNSSRFLHDRTHMRINNASLSYVLKKEWMERLRLNSASIYLQADNLGFWTPYQVRKDRNTYRNSFDAWPEVRTISLGTSLSF